MATLTDQYTQLDSEYRVLKDFERQQIINFNSLIPSIHVRSFNELLSELMTYINHLHEQQTFKDERENQRIQEFDMLRQQYEQLEIDQQRLLDEKQVSDAVQSQNDGNY